jgi:hypothetical protein
MPAPTLFPAKRTFVFGLALVLAIPILAVPATATAGPKGDQAAVAKVTDLNKKALDAYGKEDYDTARALLKEALEVCATAGLDQHPITARTHIHFGVVAIVGFKQREVGIKQFRKALEIQPDIKLTKQLVTPALQDAFEEAVLASNGSGGGDQGGGGPAGGGDQGGGDDKGAPSVQADDSGDGEGASAPRRPRPPPRKRRNPDGDDADDKDKDEGPGQNGNLFIAMAAGTGLGIASGKGALDPSHQLSSAGFAMAQAGQIAPEIGYFLSRDLLLSLALRFQYVVGLNGKASAGCSGGFCDPGAYAAAAFGKVTYMLTAAPVHFTIGGQIGGGYIRHAVAFNDHTCGNSATGPQNVQCVDTLDGGPFLIGPTAGVMFELGNAVDLIASVNSALGVPNFTFNFDIQAGIGVRL